MSELVRSSEGKQFLLGGDVFTIKRSARKDGDRSMTHLVVAPGSEAPCHAHDRYEETFYILDGELEFTLHQENLVARAGDYIAVPAGVRHGYVNRTKAPVTMLFEFSPGGMEELFYEFRDEGPPVDWAAYAEKAARVHGTVYEA